MVVYRHEQTPDEKARSKRARGSQRKGKRGEKECADIYRVALADLIEAKLVEVTQKNQGKWSGKHRPEVGIHPWGNYHEHWMHIEVKRDKAISLAAAYAQARRDAMAGAIPVAVCKRPYEPEIIVIEQKDDDKMVLSSQHPLAIFPFAVQLKKNLRSAFMASVAFCAEGNDRENPCGCAVHNGLALHAYWLHDYMPFIVRWVRRQVDAKEERG